MAAPVETKVKAGAAGAGFGAAVGAFACWLLDAHLLTPGVEGDLPLPVTGLVMTAAAAGVAWVSGYIAKHTPRLSAGGVVPSGIQVTLTPGDQVVPAELAEKMRQAIRERGAGPA